MFIFVSFFIEIVFGLIIFSVIFKVVKRMKNSKNNINDRNFKNTISNANDSNSYGNAVSEEPIEVYCEYCGTKFNKIKKKCPSCGAKIHREEK